MCELSIITCVYNEEDNIPYYFESIIPILNNLRMDYEIIIVNDGSTDNTQFILESIEVECDLKIITLSRNFGKENALTAGLENALGNAVIPIDVDLQEPLETIPKFVEKWKEGYKHVIGIKQNRKYEPKVKRLFTDYFYQILTKISKNKITPNSSDFRLMDKVVVNELIKLREANRFMKGLYNFPGFSSTTISYQVMPRIHNKSKWTKSSLFKLSLNALFGFSNVPIKIWSYFGLTLIILSLLYSFILILKALISGIETPGYITTIIIISIFGGTQLIAIGILGEYISRTFEQVKNRPLFIVDKIIKKESRPSFDVEKELLLKQLDKF